MAKILSFLMCAVLLFNLAGCGGQQSQPSYEENKKMVLDLLKTDDGKKAMRDLLKDNEFRQAIVLDEPTIHKTIVQTLTTEQGQKLWRQLMNDPDFQSNWQKRWKATMKNC